MPAPAAVVIEPAADMRRALTAPELRRVKSRRDEFLIVSDYAHLAMQG
jgi:hypothetical protein